MFLEQLIVKHGAHEQCLNIKECHQGLDFYFGNRSHAQKFVDFLQVRTFELLTAPLLCLVLLFRLLFRVLFRVMCLFCSTVR